MLSILSDISPVFLVIALGFFSRRLGFLPDGFVQPANRLVYYLAIPLLIFGQVASGNFSQSFAPRQIAGTLMAVGALALFSLALAALLRLSPSSSATFSQNSIHGNLGYVGLAVVLYVLGQEGLAEASVLAGFLMLAQNLVSLALFAFLPRHQGRITARKVRVFLGNPIVLASLLGLVFSAAGIHLPGFLDRAIRIVSEMALPLALLIIGGSLRSETAARIPLSSLSSSLKLLLLPLLGLAFFHLLGVGPSQVLTAVILLGSPSATISYVMAREMDGDPELAATAVTTSTVLSIATYTLWIALLHRGG